MIRAPLVPLIHSLHEVRGSLVATSIVVPGVLAVFSTAVQRFLSPKKKLRIGVDIRPFYEPLTGVGWYLHHLLKELGRRGDIELVFFGELMIADWGPALHAEIPAEGQTITFDFRGAPLTRASRPMAALGYELAALLSQIDVFFGANYFLPRPLAAVAKRRVVTIHDLTYKRFPELLQKETLANLEREMERSIAQADAIICVSDATRRDVLAFYSVDPRRTAMIHSGLEPLPPNEPPRELPEKYLLFVSTIEPRKNLTVLVDAFEQLRDEGEYEGKLVIVGKVGWKAEPIMQRIETSRWRSDMVHLDYLSRPQLGAVYEHAGIFVMPSIYEGFGFPLLEAMSKGVPTIAADCSSLPEVGGDAALYFEPSNSEALAHAIRRIESDPKLREDLARRGRERAAAFTWKRAADQTAALFLAVAER